ncbi:hypothetical protein CLPU_7c00170 [Gottschalkia purinilytica]|uniref:Uncharacterized protein n=1 Tax=Gottschalkia purinilytica TaxID=1503 RepID=A0A0L0WA37_GOTPU|nr:ABC transporter substrate-binding (seleno)protein SaoB [Gottschalkia purinilytica]KNF08389.1 hypothetical protein CLPU_7c00170 [Gottschalkia purinilytica]
MRLINKRTVLLLIVMIIIVLIINLPKESSSEKIKVGVSDDSSGIVLNYMIKNGFKAIHMQKDFETYSIKDCCSNTSQWALTSDLLDISILCPDAAKALVEKDSRFEINSIVMLNSDIFVLRKNNPKKIGITQKRYYQKDLVKERFGNDVEIVPMISTALPYALEKGMVDGIVIDILKGLSIDGEKLSAHTNKDIPTYVLVVRKDFKKDARYKEFIENFKIATTKLNNEEILLNELKTDKENNFGRKEVENWKNLKVKLVYIISQEH